MRIRVRRIPERHEQPPRRRQRPVRRRQRPLRQELDQHDDLVVAGHQGQRRGHLGRLLLIPMASLTCATESQRGLGRGASGAGLSRRRWRRLGLLLGSLGAAWALVVGVQAVRARVEFQMARAEIARGRLEPARRRLAALASARPGVLGGAAEYWLGVCEASLDHPDAALRAFARVPEGFPYDTNGAYLEARANLARGHLHAAERRLERTLARGGPDLGP